MALEEGLEPPTRHEESTQHEGKTFQQIIDEGARLSQQNPIDIDQFDDGPGLSYDNPIDVDNPTDITNPYVFQILLRRSDDSLAKQWEEINNGRNRSNPLQGGNYPQAWDACDFGKGVVLRIFSVIFLHHLHWSSSSHIIHHLVI